jgi:hypothetical protein
MKQYEFARILSIIHLCSYLDLLADGALLHLTPITSPIPLHIFLRSKRNMESRFACGVRSFHLPLVMYSCELSALFAVNLYISQHSPIFAEGVKGGYLIKRSNGHVWQWDLWQPGLAILDVTNPAAREWYNAKLHKLLDLGVDCFKVRILLSGSGSGDKLVS